ncbi:phage protein [Streptococcus pneumoniae]|nr:phage protein [Streptococcus pneumoniae]
MVTDIEQARKNYMADYTPVDLTDAHKLLELAEKLQNEDISINTYELYKHPEAREKLFWQVAEEIDRSKTTVYLIRQKAIEHLAGLVHAD